MARVKPKLCPGCRSRLESGTRFCKTCGFQAEGRERDPSKRSVLVILLVFTGVLGAILVGALAGLWAQALGHVFVGLGALWLMGTSAFRESLAGTCRWRDGLLGVGTGLVLFGVSAVYVLALEALLSGAEAEVAEVVPLWLTLITNVLQPALIEEWLCRGVLWIALSRISSKGVTVFSSAALFALMHGLNGGYLFELPHRFLAGLGLGFLRLKTGSLLPCILAHGAWNLAAILLLE